MQPLPAIDHREEGQYPRLVPVESGDELGELVERADRQRSRDHRDEQHVGGVQHALGQQRDARRAVEEDHVVIGPQRRQQPAQLAGGLLGAIQHQVEVPVGEVGRKQVQVVEVGPLDRALNRAGALEQRPAAALDPGPDPEQEARRGLRVQVPEQYPVAVARGQVGEIDGS